MRVNPPNEGFYLPQSYYLWYGTQATCSGFFFIMRHCVFRHLPLDYRTPRYPANILNYDKRGWITFAGTVRSDKDPYGHQRFYQDRIRFSNRTNLMKDMNRK